MEINTTKENIHIVDSYLVSSKTIMYDTLMYLRSNYDEESCTVLKRSNESLINEWCGHNLLYSWHMFRSHTKDVDLEANTNYFKTFGYWLLKLIYDIKD